MIHIVDRLEYLLAVLAVCGPSFLYSVHYTLYVHTVWGSEKGGRYWTIIGT